MHMYQCEHADGWGEKWSLIRGTNHDPEKVNVKADGKMQQHILNAIRQHHLHHHTTSVYHVLQFVL